MKESGTMATIDDLKVYKCHKEVRAGLIKGMNGLGSGALLFIDAGEGVDDLCIRVDEDYVRKHNPQEGGYLVEYGDGYLSWSPAKAFEEGYSELIEGPPPEAPAKPVGQPVGFIPDEVGGDQVRASRKTSRKKS